MRLMDYEKLDTEVRGRIRQLQTEKGFTENGLAQGETSAQKRINRQLSHGAALTLDTVLRILMAYPDVSADWLLRGAGEMQKASAPITGAAGPVTGKNATVIGQQTATLSETFVRDLLAEKDKTIQTLLTLLGK